MRGLAVAFFSLAVIVAGCGGQVGELKAEVTSATPGGSRPAGACAGLESFIESAWMKCIVVVQQVRTAQKGHGLNVESGEVEDLVKSGIIDPTMVTRSALQNAASIAKNILTTEAVVAEAPEKDKMGAGMGGGMPDMM